MYPSHELADSAPAQCRRPIGVPGGRSDLGKQTRWLGRYAAVQVFLLTPVLIHIIDGVKGARTEQAT